MATPASRDQQILALYASGATMHDLAAQFGISRQRVHQIIRRLGGADADTARAVRRQVRDEQQSALVESFIGKYQEIIVNLAASGLARADIEGRFALLLPEIPSVVIRDGLAKADVIFDANIQEYAFPTAAIEAAVWYAIAYNLGIRADLSAAIHQIVLSDAWEVAAVLDQEGLPAETRPEILILIANARSYAAKNEEVTITRKRYDEIRRDILDDLGLVSAQGVMPWPPTAQTVMKRLGGGYWAEALRNIGLTPDERGRERGLLRFAENDYDNAIVDFLAQANAMGRPPTFDAYGGWVDSEDRAGRRRPSAAAVRMRYTNSAHSLSTSPKTNCGASWQSLRGLLHLKHRESLKTSLRITGENLNTHGENGCVTLQGSTQKAWSADSGREGFPDRNARRSNRIRQTSPLRLATYTWIGCCLDRVVAHATLIRGWALRLKPNLTLFQPTSSHESKCCAKFVIS